MHLELRRVSFTANTTLGRLYVDGKFFCWTLEDVLRHPGVKVKHKTAIPAGWYKVVVNTSNKFKRLMPLIIDTPNFRGVRIHRGNDETHTSGCPLVGYKWAVMSDGDCKIWESTQAENDLTKMLYDHQHGGGTLSISIVNDFNWDGRGE